MASTKRDLRKLLTYKVGYTIGMSKKVLEIEIRGLDCYADDYNMATTQGRKLWLIVGRDDQTVFQIPLSSLKYCVVEAAIAKRKKKKYKTTLEVVPIHKEVRVREDLEQSKA